MSVLVNGLTCQTLNKDCSVHHSAGLNTKDVIKKCLIAFPYIWASITKLQLMVDA